MKLRRIALFALMYSCSAPSPVSVSPAPTQAHVTVEINFGSTDRPALHGELDLPRGSTPIDAARAFAPVEQDWLCCSSRDVWSIGGVGPDARLDRYWLWFQDGGLGQSAPADHELRDGEHVRWVYHASGSKTRAPNASAARVLSLVPAATDIVIAVGGEDLLVGLSQLCAQPAGKTLPRVVSTPIDSDAWDMATIDREVHKRSAAHEKLFELDEERISALAPTLVLSQGVCPVCAVSDADAQEKATPACAKLLVLTPRTLAGVADDIRRVGEAIGRTGAGKVAARAFERRIETVRALPALAARPNVLVLEWFEPLWVSGEWIAEMVETAGGTPLLATAKDHSRHASWNELIAADPDVIVLSACSMSIERAEREVHLLTDRPEWPALRAVRNGRVFLVRGDMDFSSPGPGLAHGVEVLAEVLRAKTDTNGRGWKALPAMHAAGAEQSGVPERR